MRLVIVAAPADAAERASRLCWEGELGSKLAADRFVDRAAVRILAGQTRHHRLHDLAHVFDRGRAGLGDGFDDSGLDVRCGRRGRELLLEDRDFGRFLVDQIGAPGLRELLNGIATLFDQR